MKYLYNTRAKREVKVTDELFAQIMKDKNRSKYFSEIVKVIDETVEQLPDALDSYIEPTDPNIEETVVEVVDTKPKKSKSSKK